jgi:hypothetical protein
MKNRDNSEHKTVHLFIALRRRKDNPDGKELCFRQIIVDPVADLSCIYGRIHSIPGIWRVHKTINARDTEIASKILFKKYIDDPSIACRLVSEYKTALMKPEAKAERNILLDIDTKDTTVIKDLLGELDEHNVEKLRSRETPNGFHIVCEKFDTRIVEGFPDLTLQRDGYVFIDRYSL